MLDTEEHTEDPAFANSTKGRKQFISTEDNDGEESFPLSSRSEMDRDETAENLSHLEFTKTRCADYSGKDFGQSHDTVVDPIGQSHDTVVDPIAEVEGSEEAETCIGEGDGKFDYSHKRATNQKGCSRKLGRLKLDEAGQLGKDELDTASIFSYYMESDFRYYFQHPYARLITAYLVIFCNFFIYAEDPVAHSRKECNIPAIGNCFAFVCMQYPPNAWSLLKVVMWLGAILVGLVVGKLLFHTLIFNKLFRLKMFTSDKGSWMTMFLTTIISLTIVSNVYNGFLMIGGGATTSYHISGFMSIGNDVFMKVAATGTWCGDFFTAWMVTDIMLQEKLYPKWAMGARRWWNSSHHRIVLFWVVVVVSSFLVIFVVATDYINWDRLNRDFLHSNELSRAFLASFILVLDVTIIMQDWDFPHFISAIDIKLPGLNTAHIHFKIPRLLKKLEYWHVHITGKWFNYGILFIVLILDLNMLKNQIFYVPFDYGQYVDSEGRIHSVNDNFSLGIFNETFLAFWYRNTTINPFTNATYIQRDNIMNARYMGYSMGLKALAFIPTLSTFFVLGVMIWMYGRRPKPTKEDPYGGRLKKRKKHRFSTRSGWLRLFKTVRRSQVVLTGVQTVDGNGDYVDGGNNDVDGGGVCGDATQGQEVKDGSETRPDQPAREGGDREIEVPGDHAF